MDEKDELFQPGKIVGLSTRVHRIANQGSFGSENTQGDGGQAGQIFRVILFGRSLKKNASSRFGHHDQHPLQGNGRSLRVASSAHPHCVDPPTPSTMLNRSEYQPISQSVDNDEADVTEPIPSPSVTRARSSSISKKIDLRKLDNAFKRCASSSTFQGRL